MGPLSLTVLGSFAIRCHGMRQALHISGRTKELLAMLAINFNRNLRRAAVMDNIWGDICSQKASSSLSTAIWRVNKLLDSYDGLSLQTVDDLIGLHVHDDVNLDIRNLDRGMSRIAEYEYDQAILSDDERAYLKTIIDGPQTLLEGCAAHWALAPRENYSAQVVTIQTKLLRDAFECNDYTTALQYGRDILSKDNFREGTQREVMWLYVLNGQKAKAVNQYLDLKRLLKDELGIQPMEETTALFDYIRHEGEGQTVSSLSYRPGGTLITARQSIAGMEEARRDFLRILNPA